MLLALLAGSCPPIRRRRALACVRHGCSTSCARRSGWRHYSPRTADAYAAWARRYIVFHGKRHPRTMGATEVTAFLSDLARRGASASTQNQALSALVFLYEIVLGEHLPWMNDIVRAQRPARLPVVLSRDEVARLLAGLRGVTWLMAP